MNDNFDREEWATSSEVEERLDIAKMRARLRADLERLHEDSDFQDYVDEFAPSVEAARVMHARGRNLLLSEEALQSVDGEIDAETEHGAYDRRVRELTEVSQLLSLNAVETQRVLHLDDPDPAVETAAGTRHVIDLTQLQLWTAISRGDAGSDLVGDGVSPAEEGVPTEAADSALVIARSFSLPARCVLRMAAVDVEVLEKVPQEKSAYVLASIFAILAAVSEAVMFGATFGGLVDVPSAVKTLVALGFGTMLFTFYRLGASPYLRSTGRSALSRIRIGISLISRLVASLLLAVVVTTPVLLGLLRPEVARQVDLDRTAEIAAVQQQLATDPTMLDLQDQLARDRGVIAGGVTALMVADTNLQNAREQYDKSQDAVMTQAKGVACEKAGTCGSGIPGTGIAYKERQMLLKVAERNRTQALDRFKQQERVSRAAAESQLSTTREASATLTARLQKQRESQSAVLGAAQQELSGPSGLLERLSALGHLIKNQPAARFIQILLLVTIWSLHGFPLLARRLLDRRGSYGRLRAYRGHLAEREAVVRYELEQDIRLSQLVARAVVARRMTRTRLESAASVEDLPQEYEASLRMVRETPESSPSREKSKQGVGRRPPPQRSTDVVQFNFRFLGSRLEYVRNRSQRES